jgi:hypothetical protein
MDKKTKIFFIVFGLLILGSVIFTYYRIMIKRDYVISSQIDCDPYAEKCFIWKCDPDAVSEDEKCTNDPENDIWYYKIVYRKANKIPLCDSSADENCDLWTCEEKEKNCGETLCDDETKIEQEAECNNPEAYASENPIEETTEETSVECAENDMECMDVENEKNTEE